MRAWFAAAALALAACAAAPAPRSLPAQTAAPIRIEAAPVPLNADDPAQARIGRFAFAGGLALTSRHTQQLHGLSDLKIWPDGRLLAVSDMGQLLQARLVLDASGRPRAVTNAVLQPLPGADGQPLADAGKAEADSEGVAQFPNGDRLVSLERDHRILLYPANGGPPRRAPAPREDFPANLGLEALDLDPAAGPDAYVVGAEGSGQTWTCHLAGACTAGERVAKRPDAGLSAVAVLPGGRRAYLVREFGWLSGFQVTLRIVDAKGTTLDELRLARPLSADNYEGLAALPRPDGSIRFYLISDDNFSGLQRTLLLGFDWR